ncbi:MAG: glycosyl transferase, partial [Blautia sp.]|nr:glycosyl transferase [Blautia sp.]
MKFGYFDDAAKEYVITTPRTPLPWINYLGSKDFFSLISNTCGGYSFYKDAKLLRITRYRYNNIPADSNGKYYYIKDGENIWNPGFMPSRTPLDEYECRHGLSYSHFHGARNGLSADLLAFVPVDASCEVNRLTLTNTSASEKSFSVFSYVEFCLWNAVDDGSNFQRNLSTGEVEIEGSTIYHKTEYRERRNHYSFFSVNAPVDGFDTSRDDFLGAGNGNEFPDAVAEDKARNSVASGWYPIASHQIRVTLKPGEKKDLIFVLGYSENPQDQKFLSPNVIRKDGAHALLAQFDTVEKTEAAFEELKAYWNGLLSTFIVNSGNEHINRMANIWNQYQCMITFNMSRSASYYESGMGRGMGFRDSCQDLLGFVHLVPERARE